MANKMRWRYGDTNPVMHPVETGDVVEVGDLVYLTSGKVRPASQAADTGSATSNQEVFHDAFVGVAMQASPAGRAGSVRVATTGVFEFDCAAATFELGQLIGLNETSSGDALEDQEVVAVATENLAIGRCAQRVEPAATRVLVDVVSVVTRGGPQAAA
ncbi:MAG: capsid cement protein [Planctomycetota bacterium]